VHSTGTVSWRDPASTAINLRYRCITGRAPEPETDVDVKCAVTCVDKSACYERELCKYCSSSKPNRTCSFC
jgi:hypothetical protein